MLRVNNNSKRQKKISEINPLAQQAAISKYQQNHPEAHRAAVIKYQKQHPEVHRAAAAKYQEQYPEVHRRVQNKYDKNNPGIRVDRRNRPWKKKIRSAMEYDLEIAYETDPQVSIGLMDFECKYCGALKWKK